MSTKPSIVGVLGVVLSVACQEPAKPGDAKPGDAKSGDAKSGDAKSGDAKPGDAKPGETKLPDGKRMMSRRASYAYTRLDGSDPALDKCKAALESIGSDAKVDDALAKLSHQLDDGTYASTTALAELGKAYGAELPLTAGELDTCVQTFQATRKQPDPGAKTPTADIDCPGGTLCQCDTGPICCPSGEDCACSCDDEGGICTPYCECFPGSARVRRSDGELVPMHALKIGDRIEVVRDDGTLGFEDVYLFTHKDPDADARFVELRLAGGETLALTARHFVPVGTRGSAWSEHRLLAAEQVRVGQRVWTRDARGRLVASEVVALAERRDRGLFNPLTLTGTIVVDGVIASAHSDWFLDGFVGAHTQGRVYQAMFAPVRSLYRVLGPRVAITIAEEWGVVDRLRDHSTALHRRALAWAEHRRPRALA